MTTMLISTTTAKRLISTVTAVISITPQSKLVML